jgi:tRNA dimethylallyltransferase
MTDTPLIIVCGPTASGKSGLAVTLAKALNGEVLNIDSAQIYRDVPIGSAQITPSEQLGIPHHLVAERSLADGIDVAEYVARAREVIVQIEARNRSVIAVGGTGLYVKALLHGLADLPGRDTQLRAELAKLSTHALREKLQTLDAPREKKILGEDRLRLIRAIEICTLSGNAVSNDFSAHNFREVKQPALLLELVWEREALYERINRRTQAMFQAGLVDETKRIVQEFGSDAHILRALGYAQVLEGLKSGASQATLQELVATKTRQFAKRQISFWRNQPQRLGWVVDPKEGVVKLPFEELISRLRNRPPTNRVELWRLDATHL